VIGRESNVRASHRPRYYYSVRRRRRYYGYRSYGSRGLGGALGLVVIILLIVWLLGGLTTPAVAP
jgi:hypothetical protein